MAIPAPIELSTISMPDTLIIMILALVFLGPRRLPQVGRQIGKLMYEFRKASNDFKFQMEEELRLAEETDRRKKEEAARQQGALAAPQTVEAQADIGAAEPSNAAVPVETAPEQAAEEEPEVVHLPRVAAPIIQRPSTGDPVPATRRNGVTVSPAEVSLEASPGAEQETQPQESAQTEPTTQHG
ncbi:MAG: twin-arginine translocase TatA/TatE family subunit [Acidobacteriota bacterium]